MLTYNVILGPQYGLVEETGRTFRYRVHTTNQSGNTGEVREEEGTVRRNDDSASDGSGHQWRHK